MLYGPAFIPIPEPIMFLLKQTVTSIVSVVDKTKQKKEYRNISTLGNIEYLQKAATNSAGLLTLYYKEQLDSIDMSKKVEGNHRLATFFTWANNKLDGKPSENAIVLVAEYAVAWIIDALKEGDRQDKDKTGRIRNFVPNQPLADQLWLCVAKQDPMVKMKIETLGFEMGQHKVPLKNGKFIPLKRLFGCPIVVAGGAVYQYQLPSEESTENDPIQYGYVYLDPFTYKVTGQLIVEKRKLIKKTDQSGKPLPDILDNVGLFREGGESTSLVYDVPDVKQTAISLAHSMREQNLLVGPDQLKHSVQKVRSDIVHEVTMEVDVLRDDFNAKAACFQTSIDAAYEKITKDFEKCQEELLETQKAEYQTAARKLVDQIKQSQQQLEAVIKKRTQEMEQLLNEKCEQQDVIVQKAEQKSIVAVNTSTEAKELSMASEQSAKQSAAQSQKLVESTEQRKQEMQKVIDECVEKIEKTIAEQKQAYDESLSELQANARLEMERMRQQVEILTLKASEAARAADKSASDAKTTQKNTNVQIEVMKEERKKLLKEAKEAREASEKAANHARDAERSAKDSKDHSKKSQEKVEKMAKRTVLETTA
ncbi:unnamed protein product [Didymodactylos carnosus]|uniref:Uncharacterized protein n=1 Tax=Didymodactylos carnosus TaxID=1234261 RepID=A0A8S2JLU8_9BILA|nr:unnamed protein product [Didymodactylos carnosus]CAF3805085.1 unnamed protein product [Didymodactylos carnosus]